VTGTDRRESRLTVGAKAAEIPLLDTAIAFLVAVLALAIHRAIYGGPHPPEFDALFYINYGLSLADYGVLGDYGRGTQEPVPGFGSAPAYPAFLALLFETNQGFRDGFACFMQSQKTQGLSCELNFLPLLVAQTLLMGVFLASVWATAWLLFGQRWLAWLAMILALASGEPQHYSKLFLTEALVLPLFGLFSVFLLLAYRRPSSMLWPVLCGLSLGALALTRPTFAYLFWFAVIAGSVLQLLCHHRRRRVMAVAALALAYAAVTVPWLARNYVTFDQAALTGGYGESVLCQRLAYNRMGWDEWGVAFVYFFPRRGEAFAKALFPEPLYEKLGVGEKAYVWEGIRELCPETRAAAGGPDRHLGYLIKTEVLGQPVWHALVSMPLMVRGMFIGNPVIWSVAGWLAAIWFLVVCLRQRRWDFPILMALPLFNLVFNAAVSVSIARYNIILIPVLSCAMAYAGASLLSAIPFWPFNQLKPAPPTPLQ